MNNQKQAGFGRGAALLSVGIGGGGLLTYGYFALASNVLDPPDYGALTILWSVLFISVVTLYRPVEQFISRSLSENATLGTGSAHELRVGATIQALLAATFVAVALAFRGPIESGPFGGQDELYWILVLAAPTYAVSFFARGYFAGIGRFGLYGAMLILEATSRFAMAALVVVGLLSGTATVAFGILLAPLMSLVVVPLLYLDRRRRGGDRGAEPRPPAPAGPSISRGGRFVGAAALILLSEQALLNAGVLIVSARMDAAAAGFIFNILLIARAPQVLFGAVTTSLLPTLTRFHAAGDEGGRAASRASVLNTIRAIAGFTAAAAVVVLAVGPQLMQATFGDDFTYERAGLVIVVVAMGLHLSASTLTQLALARDRATAAAVRWALCALGFIGLSLLPVFEEVREVEVAYAAAAASLTVMLLLLTSRPGGRPAPRA